MVVRLALPHLDPEAFPRIEVPRLPQFRENLIVKGDVPHSFSVQGVDESPPEPWVRVLLSGNFEQGTRATAIDPIDLPSEDE